MKPFVDAVPTPKEIDPDFRARVVALDSAARAGRLPPGECNDANLIGAARWKFWVRRPQSGWHNGGS